MFIIFKIIRVIYNSFTIVNNNVEHEKTITMNVELIRVRELFKKNYHTILIFGKHQFNMIVILITL